MADDLCDPALRLFLAAAVRSNLCNHLMAVYRTFGTLLRDKNILKDFLIVRNHKAKMFALFIDANHFRDRMGDDLCDASFLTFPGRPGDQSRLNHISVKSIADVFF